MSLPEVQHSGNVPHSPHPSVLPNPDQGQKSCQVFPRELLAIASPSWSWQRMNQPTLQPINRATQVSLSLASTPARPSSHHSTCFLSPEIMPRGLLWLGLALLGALHAQAQDSSSDLIPAPPLSKVPLQQNFQDNQVRGQEEHLQVGPGEEWEQRGGEVKRLRRSVGQDSRFPGCQESRVQVSAHSVPPGSLKETMPLPPIPTPIPA